MPGWGWGRAGPSSALSGLGVLLGPSLPRVETRGYIPTRLRRFPPPGGRQAPPLRFVVETRIVVAMRTGSYDGEPRFHPPARHGRQGRRPLQTGSAVNDGAPGWKSEGRAVDPTPCAWNNPRRAFPLSPPDGGSRAGPLDGRGFRSARRGPARGPPFRRPRGASAHPTSTDPARPPDPRAHGADGRGACARGAHAPRAPPRRRGARVGDGCPRSLGAPPGGLARTPPRRPSGAGPRPRRRRPRPRTSPGAELHRPPGSRRARLRSPVWRTVRPRTDAPPGSTHPALHHPLLAAALIRGSSPGSSRA